MWRRRSGTARLTATIAAVAVLCAVCVQKSFRKEVAGPAFLFSWGQLGASLDNSVPQSINAGASDVGGLLVRKHAPSGRMPGFGGGSHLLDDGIVALHRDIRHDLGFRRSERGRLQHILGSQKRARSLAWARDVLRRAREPQGRVERTRRGASIRMQQMALQQTNPPRQPDDDITESTVEEAYKRAARLAAKHKGQKGRSSSSTSSKWVTPPNDADVEGAYAKAARLAETAAKTAAAPSGTDGKVVGDKNAALLSKAAVALKSVTNSLNAGDPTDPSSMAAIAASLASLSDALAHGRNDQLHRSHLAGAPAVQKRSLSTSSRSVDASASRRRQAQEAAEARKAKEQEAKLLKGREERIQEDILYHLDELGLLPGGGGGG